MRIKTIGFFLILVFDGLTIGCGTVKNDEKDTPASRPNIVFIIVDDLGWKDLGYTGSAYYETPNVDQLAGQGMIFTQAYAAAANCAPSRACLMSGLNTPRHGIYTVANSDRGNKKTLKIIPTRNNEILPDSIHTLAEMLHDHGYVTGTFGKWHLGQDPKTQGFQVNIGGSLRGSPGKDGYFSPYKIENIADGPRGEYLTDRIASEAIQFMKDHSDTTFFLYLPFYTVHTPIMGKKELVDKYEKKPGAHGQDHPDYAAMVASMDENVGRVMAALDSFGLTENTIVFFTSDNGGIRDISYQDPLRAGKGSYYEGGIRVPLIIRWPGTVQPGSRSEVPVTNLDFYPTIAKVTGAEMTVALDGEDITPVLQGETFHERSLFWHFPIYLQAYNPKEDGGRDPLFRTRPGSVIRNGNWKLHEYFEDEAIELYNLETDPGEAANLAQKNPGKAEELLKLLREWRRQTNAPVPEEPNPAYDPAFEKNLIRKVNM